MNASSYTALDFLAFALMLTFALTADYLDWFTKYAGFAMLPLIAFYFFGKYVQKKQLAKKQS